jgi:ankyrin repeat protein
MKTDKKLEKAILQGDLVLAKSLIESGCNVNEIDKNGRTIIYDAIVKGDYEIVQLLCKANTNVNVKDIEERTPLHFTAIHNKLEIAKLLIEYGAIIDAQDKFGNTPLGNAVFYSKGYPDLIAFLREQGADPDLKNNYDISPKELAESIANYDLSYLFEDN